MIAVDTNVLVRILVDDPGEKAQVTAARARVRQAGRAYVPQIVQAETVWVLEAAYRVDKHGVIAALEHLRSNQAYLLQSAEAFDEALRGYRAGTADFADYLILAESRVARCGLATFDKRLAKAPGAAAV